jgi:hypothetical protein
VNESELNEALLYAEEHLKDAKRALVVAVGTAWVDEDEPKTKRARELASEAEALRKRVGAFRKEVQ